MAQGQVKEHSILYAVSLVIYLFVCCLFVFLLSIRQLWAAYKVKRVEAHKCSSSLWGSDLKSKEVVVACLQPSTSKKVAHVCPEQLHQMEEKILMVSSFSLRNSETLASGVFVQVILSTG